MRVISGSAKGRPLKAVPGQSTRPTSDKVKEALFSMIGPYFTGGIALDLFAGTGGLSIEALSRGVERAIMVDANPDSIRIIRHNLSITGFTEQTELYRNDAVRAVKALLKRGITVDIVFLDPPYKLHVYDSLIQLLDAGGALNDQAIIVCEHDAELQIALDIDDIQLIRHTVYGDTAITLFRKGGDS